METFYTLLVGMGICIIGILIYSFRNYQNKSLNIFRYYLICYIILCLLIFYRDNQEDSNAIYISNIIVSLYDVAFTIFEFFVFAHYMKKYVSKVIYTITISSFLFGITIIMMDYNFKEFFNEQSYLFSLQAISLLVFSTSYYRRIIRNSTVKLTQEPSFWIITGMTFLMICTLPYSLILDYVYSNYFDQYFLTFNIFYISYALLFIMIIKAFLCPQTTTK